MAFKYRKLSYLSIQTRLVEFALDELDAFLTHAKQHRDDTEARLREWARDLPDDGDRYADDFAEVVRVAELASETVIVFLYRVVEVHRNRLLQFAYPEFKKGSLDRPEILRALVLHTKKKDITKLIGSAQIEELRALNNAIKHQARVTAELARYPMWKGEEGEKFGDLWPSYRRLRTAVPKYIAAFAKAIRGDCE